MGNWPINPNTLASIDDNGKATFQEHTQDTNYTITYNNGTSGNITKTFTVYACSQPPVDCSVYEFSTITRPVEGHTTTSIAYSLRSLEQLSYTIKNSGGFLTGITIVGTSDRWQYMGEFNTTTSSSDRTATIEYKNGDGTCTFTQQLVMKGETDCSAYGFTARTTSLSSDEATNVIIAYTSGFSSVPNWDGNPTWLNGYAFMPPSQGNPKNNTLETNLRCFLYILLRC